MLPNFICPGAAKSGTTTLHDILIQHPEIYLPKIKETQFFSKKYHKGLDWYSEFYENAKNEKIIGDITPAYMTIKDSPKRIYDILGPDVKFVFMLRNPIDRAYSHYWMNRRKGYENMSFKNAIYAEKKRLKNGKNEIRYGYIKRGMYYKQISRFLKFFPIENMKFILFDEFVKDIESNMLETFEFLNVTEDIEINFNIKSNPTQLARMNTIRDFLWNPNDFLSKIVKVIFPNEKSRVKVKNYLKKLDQKFNRRDIVKPKMDSEVEAYLSKLFEEEINMLETLISRNLKNWVDK